ncbi:unnamed protein product [Urochloa humidicola]
MDAWAASSPVKFGQGRGQIEGGAWSSAKSGGRRCRGWGRRAGKLPGIGSWKLPREEEAIFTNPREQFGNLYL